MVPCCTLIPFVTTPCECGEGGGGDGGGGDGGGGAGGGGALSQQMHVLDVLQPPVLVSSELNLSLCDGQQTVSW